MGRPRKYLTEAEQIQARRDKNKKYYESHKEVVLEKRRQQYVPVDVDKRIKHGNYIIKLNG